MSDCLFCKIASGEISADKVYENDAFFAFRDIHPQAPVHVLVIPKKHIATLNNMSENDTQLLGGLLFACRQVAKVENIADSGYRIVINCNRDAGQEVFHVHAHVVGGRALSSSFA
jgi:histidine triad (HIT) family protein